MGERFFVMDIETNTAWRQGEKKIEPAAVWLYLGCLLRNDGIHRFFHSWDEYAAILNEMTEQGDTIFVHNLAYELEFLSRNGFSFSNVIANARHKPIAVTDVDFGVTYRCSYKYFDMGLEKLGDLVGLPKLGYDYTTIRRVEDLTKKDYEYNLRDCQIVVKAIEKELTIYKSIKNLPYTKTGITRRLLAESDDGELHARAGRAFPPEDVYTMLEKAFTGGLSYGSPESFGQTIHNVYSADIKSSYPAVMLSQRFPMRFSRIYVDDEADALYRRRLPDLNYVAKFEIDEAKAVDRRLCTLPFYKCKITSASEFSTYNGKVNYCSNFRLTVDSVNWTTYNRIYNFTGIKCVKITVATSMRRLPAPLIRTIAKLAADKERLKPFEKRSLDDKDNYRRVKEMLNAMYGANVQKFRSFDYSIDDFGEWVTTLKEYARPRNLMRAYSWGVWVTAYARQHLLFDGILQLPGGVDDFVYCDTDSVKSTAPLRCKPYFDDDTRVYLRSVLGPDFRPVEHFGEFQRELDGGVYDDFKHFGAKKYFYNIAGEFHYTVAGLPQPERIKEKNSSKPQQLDECKPGAKWVNVKLGRLLLDNKAPGPLFEKQPDGSFTPYNGPIYGEGGVGLNPTDYTLSVTPNDAAYCAPYGYKGGYHVEPINISEEEFDRVMYIIDREDLNK